MRLTVGPLPPAVYWRRRAIVLGGLLIVVLMISYACSGKDGRGAPNATPTSRPPSGQAAGPAPSGTVLTPESGAPETSARAATPSPTAGGLAAPGSGACTDAEMLVTPVPAKTSAVRGTSLVIRLRIKNIGQRTCSRDVGADMQELRIVNGAQTIWSSDTCGAASGHNVRSFPPSHEDEYMVTWNGRSSTVCRAGSPGGPVPPAGAYQILGRLGTKLSAPVKLTLTA